MSLFAGLGGLLVIVNSVTHRHARGRQFELLNLAGGLPAKRTLLITAIPRCQKTTHPNKPAIKLPAMELVKLTKSLLNQRQPRR